MTMATKIGVLNQGRLEQFGTPREIYENPVSTYVASRLGSPRINTLPASVFKARPKDAVTIGLRPEHIEIGDGKECVVTRLEHLGDQTRLHLIVEGHDVITRVDAHTTINTGDTVRIKPINPLYFDTDGKRIRQEMNP